MFTDLDFSSPKFDFLFISLSQRSWYKCNISSAKIPSEMEVAPRYKLLTQASTLKTETLFFLLIFPLKGVSSHNLNRPNWSKFTPPSQGGWFKYRFLDRNIMLPQVQPNPFRIKPTLKIFWDVCHRYWFSFQVYVFVDRIFGTSNAFRRWLGIIHSTGNLSESVKSPGRSRWTWILYFEKVAKKEKEIPPGQGSTLLWDGKHALFPRQQNWNILRG